MSKVVKSIKRVVKKIVKEVKRFVKSDLGKVLLIAATVYLGGAALGAWNSPFQSINGALVKGGAQVTGSSGSSVAVSSAANVNTAAGLTSTPLPGVAGNTAAVSAATPSITTAAGQTMSAQYVAPSLADAGAKTVAQQVTAGVGEKVATEAATDGVKKGIISKMMDSKAGELLSGTAKFAEKNPMATAMMLGAAGSAAAPDEIDIMREKQDIDAKTAEDERQRRNENLAGTKDVNMGAPITRQPLRFMSTGQPILANGIINSNRSV